MPEQFCHAVLMPEWKETAAESVAWHRELGQIHLRGWADSVIRVFWWKVHDSDEGYRVVA